MHEHQAAADDQAGSDGNDRFFDRDAGTGNSPPQIVRDIAQVGTRGESLVAGAPEDGDAIVVAGVEAFPGKVQLVDDIVRQHVVFVGPVDDDFGNAVMGFVEDFGHGFSCRSEGAKSWCQCCIAQCPGGQTGVLCFLAKACEFVRGNAFGIGIIEFPVGRSGPAQR